MSNELRTWNFEEHEIRTVEIDGEPWFVGKDVAVVLEYSDTNKAIAMHVDDEDKLNDKTALSLGQRGGWLINESGLYSLILSSKMPNAKKFKKWVTSEVLPSIRKYGAYMTADTLKKAITSPDFIIQLAQQLKDEQEKNAGLEAKIQQDKPKVDFANTVAESSSLIDNKYLYRDQKGKLKPYMPYVEDGLFELKEFANMKTEFTDIQTLVTPKGKETFRLLLA